MNFSENVVDQIKKMGRSPFFIIAVIAVGLTALLSLWFVIESIMNFAQGYYYDDGYMFAGDLIVYLIGFILTMLVALGMILFLSACISKKKPVSTTGLTIIRVIQIIQLVFTAIGFVLIFLVALIALILPNAIGMENISDYIYQYSYINIYDFTIFDGSDLTLIYNIILISALIITIIAGVLVTLYYAKTLKTIKSVRLALETGQPNNKGSVYLIVINIVLVVVSVLGIISDIISYFQGNIYLYSFIITTITNFLSLVALLSIAIVIIKYRGKMKELMNPTVNTGFQGTTATQAVSVETAKPVDTADSEIQPKSVFCTKCGSKIASGSAFCTSCGQKVE